MKLKVKLISLLLLINQFSLGVMAEKIGPFNETGTSPSINAPYPGIAGCAIAGNDLYQRANGKCIEEGYKYYILINQTNCESRLFGGFQISMRFTCQK